MAGEGPMCAIVQHTSRSFSDLVGEEDDPSVGSERPGPRRHDERVVPGDAVHGVDALLLDRLALLDVAREVAGRADGREGAGNGDDNDFFAEEDVRTGDGLMCDVEGMSRAAGEDVAVTNSLLFSITKPRPCCRPWRPRRA